MTKISALSAITGATIDAANDLITVVDDSLSGVSRNKKMTFAELVSAMTLNGVKSPNVQSATSSATVTPTFSNDLVKITAQAAGLTLANWSGTAVPGWGMGIRLKDNGTSQSIAYGTKYRAIGVTLPTTTTISKTLYLGCIYNSDDDKIDVVAVAQEA
jgi:hypothetical protein